MGKEDNFKKGLGALAVLAAGIAGLSIARKQNQQPQQRVCTCPLCQGRRMVPSSPLMNIACPVCNGQGVVAESQFQQAQAMAQQYANAAMMNLLYGSGTAGSSPSPNNRSTAGRSICLRCNGTGRCPNCAGRGMKEYKQGYTVGTFYSDCPDCHGTGRCRYCGGSGKGMY